MEKKIVLPKDVRTTGGDLWLLGLQGKKERRGEGRAVVNNTVVAYILKPQTLKNPVHKMLFCCCCCCCCRLSHHTACRILVPWPRIEPKPLALEAQSLSHWTAGNSPIFVVVVGWFFFVVVFIWLGQVLFALHHVLSHINLSMYNQGRIFSILQQFIPLIIKTEWSL